LRLGLLALAFAGGPSFAQDLKPEKAGKSGRSGPMPVAGVEERIHDLGRMREGESGEVSFVLRNNGDAPLRIIEVQTSCGCTVPRPLREGEKTLDPGEKVEIQAVFNSKGRLGLQRKTITIITNDPVEPRIHLTVAAEVVALIEVLVDGRSLQPIPLGKFSAGEAIDKNIEVLPTEPGQQLEITSLNVRSDSLAHELEPLAKDDRRGYRLKLAVVPDAVPGYLQADLDVIGRVGEELSHVTLKMNGEVAGELAFTPVQIRQTSPMTLGSGLAPVRVRSEIDKPFEILNVDAGPNLQVTVTDEGGGKSYAINLAVSASAATGPFAASLDIYTTSVYQPLIQIPVFGHVRPHVEVSPPAAFLRLGDDPKTTSRVLKLETATRKPFNVTSTSSDSPYVTVAETELPGREAHGAKYVRIALAGDVPAGRHDATVRIETDDEDQRVVTIPVIFIAQ